MFYTIFKDYANLNKLFETKERALDYINLMSGVFPYHHTDQVKLYFCEEIKLTITKSDEKTQRTHYGLES
jgi:hypothetical protein